MQITDDQFIKAMHAAVEAKGPEHRARARYLINGVPECIIGYALGMIGVAPEIERVAADTLLRGYGVSYHVAAAGRVAQVHQDQGEKWSNVLFVFQHCLGMKPCESDRPLSTSEMSASARVALHAKKVREGDTLEELGTVAGISYQGFSSGGITGGYVSMDEYPTITNATITFNLTNCDSKVFETFSGMSLAKKDHALTA